MWDRLSSLTTGCTVKEDQPLKLLLNLFFCHFNRSEPTYKPQHIKLLDIIAACNHLNVNAPNQILLTIFIDFKTFQGCLNTWKGHLIFEDVSQIMLLKVNFYLQAISAFRAAHYVLTFLQELNTL